MTGPRPAACERLRRRSTRGGGLCARSRGEGAHAGKCAAAEAVRRVQLGETIFVDCGTTMPFAVAALLHNVPPTMAGDALNGITTVCRRAETCVITPAGTYCAPLVPFRPRGGQAAPGYLAITRPLTSAGRIHRELAVRWSSSHEVPLKQVTIARADENFPVADAIKSDQIKPTCFAEIVAPDQTATYASIAPDARHRFGEADSVPEIVDR